METNDSLALKQNTLCDRMLSIFGDNHPQKEQIILSNRIIKINRKRKEQKRILLLTDKALYNLKENKLYSCQRRIHFKLIESISVSATTNEFTVHVPTEYDYRYKTNKPSEKTQIVSILSKLCNVVAHKVTDTEYITITKDKAYKLSLYERRKQLKARKGEFSTFYASNPMEEMNKTIVIPLIAPIKQHSTETPRTVSTLSSSVSLTEQTISISSTTQDKDLIYGYMRRQAINMYKLQFSSCVVDICLLYLNGIHATFDIKDVYERDDFISINDNKNILSVGKNNLLKRVVYGSYMFNGMYHNTVSWKLRINNIRNDSIIRIGIGSRDTETMVYKVGFGGDILSGQILHQFEKGDYIDVIIDLVENKIIFLINCGTQYVIKNAVSNCEEYGLAVFLSNAQIELKQFTVLNVSWKEYQQSQKINTQYKTSYFNKYEVI